VSQDPPAATPSVRNWYQSEAEGLYSLAILGGLAFPGALVGALLTAALWQGTRAPFARKAVIAAGGVAAFAVLHGSEVGWFWRLVVALAKPAPIQSPMPPLPSVAAEILLGPLLLLTFSMAGNFRSRTTLGQVAIETERMNGRSKAMRLGYKGFGPLPSDQRGWEHPRGKIRLGLNEFRQVFDLDITELSQHVFVPGATRTGKTTTLMRLAGGALRNGYGVIVIDCKGGLGPDIETLAGRFGVPLNLIDPYEPDSLGYDTCTGDPSHIANKLVGAFTYSPDAEIFKNIAMHVVPVIAKGLLASGQTVTLSAISDALGKGGLAKLGRQLSVDDPLSERLKSLEQTGGVGASGYSGLQHRLGALLEGTFGPVFKKRPALDWAIATSAPSVTYFALPTTGASEDVELFGRVITQDLKQLCESRLRLQREGTRLVPFLIMFDEFAALREARQITDLLLQASQAQMHVVVATQYLPEDIPIKTPLLQAGTLICHRIAAEDAETIAAEIGTRDAPELTDQVDYETGKSAKGTHRTVKQYRIHPDTLKELGNGATAIYARPSQRRELVQIHLDKP